MEEAMGLVLRPVGLGDEQELLAAERDMVDRDGFTLCPHYTVGEPWANYVARIDAMRTEEGSPDHLVAETSMLAVVGGAIVGRASVRHRLTDALAYRGGHIGYGVIDVHRRNGYASEMLRQCLILAGDLGIGRALLTCNEVNVGSRAVIERAGGELMSTDVADDGVAFRRYEIAVSPRDLD